MVEKTEDSLESSVNGSIQKIPRYHLTKSKVRPNTNNNHWRSMQRKFKPESTRLVDVDDVALKYTKIQKDNDWVDVAPGTYYLKHFDTYSGPITSHVKVGLNASIFVKIPKENIESSYVENSIYDFIDNTFKLSTSKRITPANLCSSSNYISERHTSKDGYTLSFMSNMIYLRKGSIALESLEQEAKKFQGFIKYFAPQYFARLPKSPLNGFKLAQKIISENTVKVEPVKKDSKPRRRHMKKGRKRALK